MQDHPRRSRRGPRTGGQDTRGAIIEAARSEFAAKGYEATSIRGIARVAGVDPALVHHYFDGKAGIFVATVDLQVNPSEVIHDIATGPPEEAGRRLIRTFVSTWDAPEARLRIQALIRGVVAAPENSPFSPMRSVLLGEIVMPYCEALGVDRVERRASLIVSQMVGLGITRYVVNLPAVAALSLTELEDAVAPVIQHYLFGDIGEPDDAPPELSGLDDDPAQR